MDFWMEKFEPVISGALSKNVRTESDQLNFFLSKLNLKDNKTEVFDILTELYYCDCCDKHQVDKPCIPVKWISNKTPSQTVINCLCDCRHTSRMICRMCD